MAWDGPEDAFGDGFFASLESGPEDSGGDLTADDDFGDDFEHDTDAFLYEVEGDGSFETEGADHADAEDLTSDADDWS